MRRHQTEGKRFKVRMNAYIVKVSVIVGIIETVIFRFGNQGS